MKNVLSVGEISDLFNMNVQTLHYYDRMGLFKPYCREAQSGYRLYKFDQIYKLATIRYLKNLGYSLEQIQSYMDTRDIHYTLDQLKRQSAVIRKEWDRLRRIDEVIQRKIRFIEEKIECIDTGQVCIKQFPIRYYLPIGSEDILYGTDYFYYYPTVVFYEDGEKSFGAFLPDVREEEEIEREGVQVKSIEAGQFFCGYHLGPYEQIEKTFERLYSEAKDRGISLAKRKINFNIIDQFVERDAENYITEVQIQVKKDRNTGRMDRSHW
ncbi:MAG: MerR family transcriptional regulator [Spirochaetaceae bacterium]|nr:MerR family transcriptional regulator [Spirochaetaceae bacterium]MCF7949445.1 MerR family transcriptional regulator [Spirochaetia bacterium]